MMLLGPGPAEATMDDLAGSEYLDVMHGMTAGQPRIDLDLERRVQETCREGIRTGLVRSAHDCSDGGLAVALAESCILGGVGFRGNMDTAARWDAALFGEKQSRIVVSVERDRVSLLESSGPLAGCAVAAAGAHRRRPVRPAHRRRGDQRRLQRRPACH